MNEHEKMKSEDEKPKSDTPAKDEELKVKVAAPAAKIEPRSTPTNVIVLADRLTSRYRKGDVIAAAAFDTFTGGVSQSAHLITNGTVADNTATTAVVLAAKAFATALTADLVIDKKNRGISTEVLS